MNALQETELEMLKWCIDICEKLQLRYYLVCGSALGAVKYKGFIPWDDDMDIGLPRPDFERFLREAPAFLPEHLFLQNYRTDGACVHLMTKLRNSNTTLIEKSVAHLPMNHGVYIDIFPLDGYPEGQLEQWIFEQRLKIFNWKRFCALKGVGNWRVRLRNSIFRALGYHKRTAQTVKQMEAMFKKYPPDQSRLWCNFGNWQGKKEYADRSQYGKGKHAVFEGVDVIVPENYDAYLTQKYGDWRKDPPIEKQVSHHIFEVIDVEKPYTDYVGKKAP